MSKSGRQNEVLNIWRVDDYSQWERAMDTLTNPEVMAKYENIDTQDDIVIQEVIQVFETAHFFREGPTGQAS
jgi:hypothetical protein